MASCCHHAQPATASKTIHWRDPLLLITGTLCLLSLVWHLWSPVALWHPLQQFTHHVVDILGTIWWGIVVGIIAVGLLAQTPDDWVPRLLGSGRGFSGLLRAVGAGLLLDLCSHGILLVGMQFYKKGASLGQVYAFLLASPWNSLSLTIVLFSLIGWGWTLTFILLSAVIALLTGWLADYLLSPSAANVPNPTPSSPLWPDVKATFRALRWRTVQPIRILHHGLAESTMLLRWLLLGVVLAAIIRAFVPTEIFQQGFAPTLAGLGLTLIATTLIEVCSEGSTPIAGDILHRAHAPGNAFTFLMAGVATDYTEMLSLRQTTGRWALALAMPLFSIPQILFLGWILNHFQPT